MLLSANAATSKAQTVKPESNTMLNPKLREIIATDTRRFLPYDRYGEPLPGMSWLPLSGEAQNGEFECFLLRTVRRGRIERTAEQRFPWGMSGPHAVFHTFVPRKGREAFRTW